MKDILLLSETDTQHFQYKRFRGLVYSETIDLQNNHLYAEIQLLKENSLLVDNLRKQQAAIDNKNIIIRTLYYLFNVSNYVKNAYLLAMFDAVKACERLQPIFTPSLYNLEPDEIDGILDSPEWVTNKLKKLIEGAGKIILVTQRLIIPPIPEFRFDFTPIVYEPLIPLFVPREIFALPTPQQEPNHEPETNDAQSTHTTSVNASVSKSAQALMLRYQDQISISILLDGVISIMTLWLGDLEVTKKTAAANRCILRLISYGTIDHQEPVSKVSIKQLLALSWLAIHDDTLRIGTLEDAKIAFIDGLYQIQREYNLSSTGVDSDEQRDRPACPAGLFNKLVEKLVGIHPDAEIIFINQVTAGLKLKIVVKESLRAYLANMPQPVGQEEVDQRNTLLDTLSDGIPGDVWDQIRGVVFSQMFIEYGVLYNNDRDNPKFIDLINNGIYVSLTADDVRCFRPTGQVPSAAASLT